MRIKNVQKADLLIYQGENPGNYLVRDKKNKIIIQSVQNMINSGVRFSSECGGFIFLKRGR